MWVGGLLIFACGAVAVGVKSGFSERSRVFELTEVLRLRLPSSAGDLKLWIPQPGNDPYQKTELAEVRSPWPHRLARDPDFGNSLLFIQGAAPYPREVEVRLRYRVKRLEQRGWDPQSRRKEDSLKLALHLKPRGLVRVDEHVRRIASETTQGIEDPVERVRAIYHYVLSHVDYGKDIPGWGRGDVAYVCRVGRGNCTDFHSLFMALSLAGGIPARFRMGYPLPKEPEGKLRGYHCWAEFYLPEQGWIPVDISEAWKHPARAEYYFGNLDPDRMVVSTGRRLRLSPEQQGEPLNYLWRPYAEWKGKPYEGIQVDLSYRDVPGEVL